MGGIGWRAWREINQVQVNTESREVFVYPDRKHGLGITGKLTAKFVHANWISWNIHRMETVHFQPLCPAGRQQRRSTSCSKVCPARWETLTRSGDYVDDRNVLLSLLVHPAKVRGVRLRLPLTIAGWAGFVYSAFPWKKRKPVLLQLSSFLCRVDDVCAFLRDYILSTAMICYLNYSYYRCKSKQLLLFTFALLINLFSRTRQLKFARKGLRNHADWCYVLT